MAVLFPQSVSDFGDRDPAVRLCHGLHKSHVKNSNNWLWCTTGGKQMWTVCGGVWTRLTSMLSFTFPLAAAHRLTWEIGRSSHITHWIPVRSASIHYSLLWSLKTLPQTTISSLTFDWSFFLSIRSTVIYTHCTHFTIILNPYMWPFIVASLSHTCVIIMLSNQNLDMPHLWGGWLSRSLTQI